MGMNGSFTGSSTAMMLSDCKAVTVVVAAELPDDPTTRYTPAVGKERGETLTEPKQDGGSTTMLKSPLVKVVPVATYSLPGLGAIEATSTSIWPTDSVNFETNMSFPATYDCPSIDPPAAPVTNISPPVLMQTPKPKSPTLEPQIRLHEREPPDE